MAILEPSAHHHVLCVPACVKHTDAGPLCRQALRQVMPAQDGHHDIGNQKMNRALVLPCDLERLVAIARIHDRVPMMRQDIARETPDRAVVLGQ